MGAPGDGFLSPGLALYPLPLGSLLKHYSSTNRYGVSLFDILVGLWDSFVQHIFWYRGSLPGEHMH